MFVFAIEMLKSIFDKKYRNPWVSGDHSGGVTPVPSPNTVVKPASADGTWSESSWESRSSPDFH